MCMLFQYACEFRIFAQIMWDKIAICDCETAHWASASYLTVFDRYPFWHIDIDTLTCVKLTCVKLGNLTHNWQAYPQRNMYQDCQRFCPKKFPEFSLMIKSRISLTQKNCLMTNNTFVYTENIAEWTSTMNTLRWVRISIIFMLTTRWVTVRKCHS